MINNYPDTPTNIYYFIRIERVFLHLYTISYQLLVLHCIHCLLYDYEYFTVEMNYLRHPCINYRPDVYSAGSVAVIMHTSHPAHMPAPIHSHTGADSWLANQIYSSGTVVTGTQFSFPQADSTLKQLSTTMQLPSSIIHSWLLLLVLSLFTGDSLASQSKWLHKPC